jgi:WhiB family transcriptional regulator, redox-sensing transcriptional regulator
VTVTTSRDPTPAGKASRPMSTVGHDRASWREWAACRDVDTELFFPIGSAGIAMAEIQRAKAICARCPVQPPCLTYALATSQEFGIWGGYDEGERRLLHRQWRESGAAAREGS